jgi:hypothetical protein
MEIEKEKNNDLLECALQYLTERTGDNPETDISDSSLYVGIRTGNGNANYYIVTLVRVKEAKLPPSTS